MMFSGYRSNFVQLEKGFYLRVDSAKKIVRDQTVLQVIDDIYKIHKDKEKEERRIRMPVLLRGLEKQNNAKLLQTETCNDIG